MYIQTTADLTLKASSTGIFLYHFKACIQQTKRPLLVILTAHLAFTIRLKGTLEADLLSHSIEPTTAIVSLRIF